MPSEHAYLSASSAYRWLVCPPIIALENLIKDRDTFYSREGTDSHSLAELKLREFKGEQVSTEIETFKAESDFYDGEMEEATDLYRDLVIERFNGHINPIMELEVKVDFSTWVPEAFGTSDVVIISDGVIEIIDLKYGKGVPVEAYQNPQLMLYALGAYNEYSLLYDFDKVRMTIVQPRLDSLTTFELEVQELLYWAENYVAPRAALAYEGIGEWNITKDSMKFSKVRAQLRPRAEQNFEVIDKYESTETALLGDDELAEILGRSEEIKSWIADVESYALAQALDGKEVKGFKLVEGRSNRKITDESAVADKLLSEGFDAEKIYKPQSLETPTYLEKLVGKNKFNELVGEYVVKPQGKLTLVPNSDKRKAYNDAQEDFKNIEL